MWEEGFEVEEVGESTASRERYIFTSSEVRTRSLSQAGRSASEHERKGEPILLVSNRKKDGSRSDVSQSPQPRAKAEEKKGGAENSRSASPLPFFLLPSTALNQSTSREESSAEREEYQTYIVKNVKQSKKKRKEKETDELNSLSLPPSPLPAPALPPCSTGRRTTPEPPSRRPTSAPTTSEPRT